MKAAHSVGTVATRGLLVDRQDVEDVTGSAGNPRPSLVDKISAGTARPTGYDVILLAFVLFYLFDSPSGVYDRNHVGHLRLFCQTYVSVQHV